MIDKHYAIYLIVYVGIAMAVVGVTAGINYESRRCTCEKLHELHLDTGSYCWGYQ